MKRFFSALNVIETKSLTLTKEVLRERQQPEISVKKLWEQTSEILKENEAEISRNENFEFEVTVKKPRQQDISGSGNYITNCQQCHVTCHYPCAIPNDENKAGCAAMGSNGYCTVCPGKCYWNKHINQKYRWMYEEVKEKRTVKELQEKYLKATEGKKSVKQLIDRLKAEYDQVQAEVVKLMQRSANCLNRLQEIALKPNPLSTPEYIDMLIEGEKQEAKPGWKQRIQSLTSIRGKAETMAKVAKGDKLLHRQESQM
ncbi:hypothetical protein EXN66_Car014219 [Channa argus]|uniref:Uncharacterized protein n=1 Tax=Channa argus TaxID=215402 RepID=A0A6G1Q877_CHAAH|nr:hypothetical protein EXN66_Car014219 [Channa argus]